MAKKEVEIRDRETAMAVLGHRPNAPAPSGQEPPPVSTEEVVEEKVPTEPVVEEETPAPPIETKTTEPKLTDAERAKLWQSNHDKLKSESDRLTGENKQLRDMLLQSQQMLQNASQLVGKYNGGAVEKPEPEIKEPKLEDFVTDDYDEDEAFNPHTKSGRQYTNYLKAREDYLIARTTKSVEYEVERKLAAKMETDSVNRRAEIFCASYPEFRNPLTGKPDLVRIEQYLSSAFSGDDGWVKIKKIQDQASGIPAPTATEIVSKIESSANAPTSIAATPEATATEQELSDEAKLMLKIFGEYDPSMPR